MDARAFKNKLEELKAANAEFAAHMRGQPPLPHIEQVLEVAASEHERTTESYQFTVNGIPVLVRGAGESWRWSLAAGTVLDSSSYPGRAHALQAALRWTANRKAAGPQEKPRRDQSPADQILAAWPKADHIRLEGRCDVCKKKNSLYSFNLPNQQHPARAGREFCGYWCEACGWSNAGSRLRTPEIARKGPF